MVRDLETLLHEHGDETETVAWVTGILQVYAQARQPRPQAEDEWTRQAVRVREQRARQSEALIQRLCPVDLAPTLPYATLATRLRTHLSELFTFVRDPAVAATNNAAERSLRPLAVLRKVSGATRSAQGSLTRMTLSSVCATARMQGKYPTTLCQQILLAPHGVPSPLTGPAV